MKEWKVTTMPAVTLRTPPRKEFVFIFEKLRELLQPYEGFVEVRNRTPTNYELWTTHSFRTKTFRPKRMQGVLFAGIMIVKNHVGLYVYALHIDDDFRKGLPQTLQEQIIGKSAFHIKHLSDEFLSELTLMLEQALKLYQKKGWVARYAF